MPDGRSPPNSAYLANEARHRAGEVSRASLAPAQICVPILWRHGRQPATSRGWSRVACRWIRPSPRLALINKFADQSTAVLPGVNLRARYRSRPLVACSSTGQRCRCSIAAAAAPRQASSGATTATIDPGRNGPPIVVDVYAPDREAERRDASSGFIGVLHSDSCSGCRALTDKGRVKFAFCWAHVQLRFCKLAAAGSPPIATWRSHATPPSMRSRKNIRGRSAAHWATIASLIETCKLTTATRRTHRRGRLAR